MKLYFFYSNESNHNWYTCKIEAWVENNNTINREGKKVSNFNCLEELRIHISKNPDSYHSCTWKHDFFKDTCFGHYAESARAFLEEKKNDRIFYFKQCNQRDFMRFKKAMKKIYNTYPPLDFQHFIDKKSPASKILF